TTETAWRAHLLFPAAGWAEKDGTFVNSERRFGLVKRVVRAPGSALADFLIFKMIAEEWGCGDMFRDWSTPEAPFQILNRLSGGRPCAITGIDDSETIDRHGGVQWPCTTRTVGMGGDRRLFADGRFFHPDGRARLVWDDPRPPAEAVSARYPLVLLTGRGSSS